MKLIVQPDAGSSPILTAIKQAKKSIDVVIFRLDRMEIATVLEAAVARGVNVRVLTAHTNRGGEKNLRKLEMRLLAGGITVSRTADDLVRYHGKMMIVDAQTLHVYGFNFTNLDINKSRSFGIVTRHKRLVHDAMKLFEADFNRQVFTPSYDHLVVSPDNSRELLTKFIKGARKELLIYDPKVSDDAILRVIAQRAKAGVDVKIIGKVEAKWNLKAQKYPGRRLHVRSIIRDGRRAFVGSQSLRNLELEKRREIGVIVDHPSAIRQMRATFEQDWAQTEAGRQEEKKEEKKEAKKEAKKDAKEVEKKDDRGKALKAAS